MPVWRVPKNHRLRIVMTQSPRPAAWPIPIRGTKDTGMAGLGTLPGGTASAARRVNGRGMWWWGERRSVDAGHGHAVHWQWLKDNGVDVDGLATMAAAGGISDAGNAVAGSLADGRVRSAEWQARRYHCRNWRRRLRECSAIPTRPSGPFSIGCKST